MANDSGPGASDPAIPVLLPLLAGVDAVVVGDLIVDHYVYAEPRRLSREAPVMVLRHLRERIGAGGAANVARNLRALGCRVRVLGVVGADEPGRQLVRMLDDESIDTGGVRILEGIATPVKTRVLACERRRRHQQILRIDRDPGGSIGPGLRTDVAEELCSVAGSAGAVIVSDYECGLIGPELGAAAGRVACSGTTVVLDPRAEVHHFAGLTALTPNVDELARCTHTSPDRLDEPEALRVAATALMRDASCRFLLVTRGNLGMALFGDGLPDEGVVVDAAGNREVADVCGAGDTAVAVFTAALSAGFRAPHAMWLANAASGVVVQEEGAAVCTLGALRAALRAAPCPPAAFGEALDGARPRA